MKEIVIAAVLGVGMAALLAVGLWWAFSHRKTGNPWERGAVVLGAQTLDVRGWKEAMQITNARVENGIFRLDVTAMDRPAWLAQQRQGVVGILVAAQIHDGDWHVVALDGLRLDDWRQSYGNTVAKLPNHDMPAWVCVAGTDCRLSSTSPARAIRSNWTQMPVR